MEFQVPKINSYSTFSISHFLSLWFKVFLWQIRENKLLSMQLRSYHEWLGVYDDFIHCKQYHQTIIYIQCGLFHFSH